MRKHNFCSASAWGSFILLVMVIGCSKDREDRPESSTFSEKTRGDELLKRAEEELKKGEYETAAGLAFAGFNKWYRRAGVRAGKTDQYLRVVYGVMDSAGPGPLLELCASVKSAHEDRMCEKIILSCFKRGAVEKKGFASALKMFEALCEDRREDLWRFHGICAGLPETFILVPGLRDRMLKIMDHHCPAGKIDISERSMCNRIVAVLWDGSSKTSEDIQILAPRLVVQGGVEGAARLLQALGAKGIDEDVRGTLERVFLQSAGEGRGLTDLLESFNVDLNRREKRNLLNRYLPVLKDGMPETAALLSQLDEGCVRRFFESMADLDIEGISEIVNELKSRLDHQPGVVLSRYLVPVGKDRKLEEKVLRLFRNEPLLVQRFLVSKMAFAPLQQRNKYRSLVAQLSPHALSGGVSGRIISQGRFSDVDLSSCRVQLVEVNTCDQKDHVKPDRKGRNTGSGKGDGERVRRVSIVDKDGLFAFENVPVGPYDAFVQCKGKFSWSRFRFGGYVREAEDSDGRKWEDRCVVTVQPLRKTSMVALHLDFASAFSRLSPDDRVRPKRVFPRRRLKTLESVSGDSLDTKPADGIKRAVMVE